jgi:3-hydroxyisobutyrate dehydrogenase
MAHNIAFLGLGSMGSRMASKLIQADLDVTVWNRSAQAAQPLVQAGAKVAATPRDAARNADLVIAMLRDDEASRDVWLDPNTGALAGMQPRALAIECSTLTVQWVKALAAQTQERGIGFIDAPVAGSRPQADAAQLIFLAGGIEPDVQRAQPVLAHMGATLQHVGAVGSGAAVKLMVNALFATQVAAMGELLGLAQRMGLDGARVLEVIAATPTCSPAAKGAGMSMLAKNFAPMFPIDLVRKDMGYALQEARAAGSHLPMVQSVTNVLDASAQAGWQDEHLTALAKLYL